LQQDYQRPPPDTDRLFQADFIHDPRGCAEFFVVNPTNLVPRRERAEHEDNPAIHYGTIASANQLMKDAFIRNKLASEKGVLCFDGGGRFDEPFPLSCHSRHLRLFRFAQE
jgi:hypothetical protein